MKCLNYIVIPTGKLFMGSPGQVTKVLERIPEAATE
jgi:hypothetical protein